MRQTTSILIILLFAVLTLSSQTNKLPIPTKSFIEKAKYLEDIEAIYFAKYLGKKSVHVLKNLVIQKVFTQKNMNLKRELN